MRGRASDPTQLVAYTQLCLLVQIPRLSEVRALLRLLQEVPSVRAWITVCCKSGNELSSGESLHEFVSLVLREDILGQVIALGVNCTAPVYIDECLQCMKEALGTSGAGRLIIVYPNSGEEWDCNSQKWKVEVETECDISSQQQSFVRRAVGWREAGAVVIGGCCRTTPEIIQSLCIALKRETT
jgi:homocysteine S-methyltransferase